MSAAETPPRDGERRPRTERADGVLHVVTVELDHGPFDMHFGYVPRGVPAYGDVPVDLGPCPDEGSAELAGALMLSIGNWRSFTVEKRYMGESDG